MNLSRKEIIWHVAIPSIIYALGFFSASEIIEHLLFNKVSETTVHFLHLLRAFISTVFIGILMIYLLRRVQARFHHRLQTVCALMDYAREGLVAFNESFAVVAFNRKASELLGEHTSANFKKWIEVTRNALKTQTVFEYPTGNHCLKITSLQSEQAGYLLLVQDVTEEKRIEEQWLLTEKMATMGRLAAGLAHEIGTPLNIISGRVELLESVRNHSVNGTSSLEKHTSIIFQQIERISKLIQQLLSQAKESDQQKGYFSMNLTIQKIVEFMRPVFEKRGLDIHLDLQADLPSAFGLSAQFEQVFINLFSNSADAIEKDGVISVMTRAEKEKVIIQISDNGRGIAKEDLTRIFDPFFTTKEFGKGTGLGLTVTSNIVHAHRGTIVVKSEEGKGTVFNISLPTMEVASRIESESFNDLATFVFPHFS